MAETEGFEPPHACASDCLPDNSLQPDLGMSPQTILLCNYFKG